MRRAPGDRRSPARTTTSSRNASGLAASVSAASAAKRQRALACSAQSASSASAIPSANGNAAERTIPAQTTAKLRLDQRVVGPHSRQSDDGERERGERDRRDRQQPDPEDRRERVVEQAVRDEAVAARVPEVVPEHEAVLEEERALVGVRGEVGPGRPEPREQRRDRGGGERAQSSASRRSGWPRCRRMHAPAGTTDGSSSVLDERHEHGRAEGAGDREAAARRGGDEGDPPDAGRRERGEPDELVSPKRMPTAVSTAWKAIPAASPCVNETPCVCRPSRRRRS